MTLQKKILCCHQCRQCSSQPSSLLNAEEQRMIREATLGFYFSKMPNDSRKTTSIFFFVKQLFMTFAMFCIELFMSFFSVSCHFSTKAIPKLQLFTVAINFPSVLFICNSVFLSFCLFAHVFFMHIAHSNLKIITDIHKVQESGFRRWVI